MASICRCPPRDAAAAQKQLAEARGTTFRECAKQVIDSHQAGWRNARQAKEGVTARALELTILAATRTSETIGARFDEFDLAAKMWTIPAERMKANKEHRVPLAPRAVAIVKELTATRLNEFVFPGIKRGEALSDMAMLMLLRDMHASLCTVSARHSAIGLARRRTHPTTFARPRWRTLARTKRMPPTGGAICSRSAIRLCKHGPSIASRQSQNDGARPSRATSHLHPPPFPFRSRSPTQRRRLAARAYGCMPEIVVDRMDYNLALLLSKHITARLRYIVQVSMEASLTKQ